MALDVTQWLGGTTHEDPIAYLDAWGKNWQDVIDIVQKHALAIRQANPILLSTIDANKIIAFLSAGYTAIDVPEAKQEFH